jgi:hypothetical protein
MRRVLLFSALAVLLVSGCWEDFGGCDFPEGVPVADCPAGVSFRGVDYDAGCGGKVKPGLVRERLFVNPDDSQPAHRIEGVDIQDAVALKTLSSSQQKSCGQWSLGYSFDLTSAELRQLLRRVTIPETSGEPSGSGPELSELR